MISSGEDESGLGIWTWTRYWGQHNVTLRIVTAYRPCKKSIAGPKTVSRQHGHYLNRKDDVITPRAAMLEDICDQLRLCQEAGDQIIIIIDANKDVRSSTLCDVLSVAGLVWGITTRHSH